MCRLQLRPPLFLVAFFCVSIGCRGELDLSKCDFERLDGRDLDFTLFVASQKPVVLTHLTDAWPARSKWATAEAFASLYGHISGYMRDHTQLELRDQDVTVAAYLEQGGGANATRSVNLSASAAFFVNDYEDTALIGSLKEDYDPPALLRHLGALRVFALERPHAGVTFHQHEAAWQALVTGEKTWFLLDPSVESVPQHDPCTFLQDHAPPLAKYCVLQAGEVMYVPRSWWHATCSMQQSIAIGGVSSTTDWPPALMAARRGDAQAFVGVGDVDASRLPANKGIFVGGERPLFMAAAFGHASLVEALLARRADANVRRNDGRTALHEAARRGDLRTVKLLHGGGADLGLKDTSGSTALHHACAERGSAEVVQYLSSVGVDSDVRRADGRAAIHVACRSHTNPVPVLRALLQQVGVPPSPLDSAGMTPLMHCAAAGHAQGVGLLLRFGGRESAAKVDGQNRDALAHALTGRGDEGVITRLLSAGLPAEGRLLDVARLGELGALRLLFGAGASTSGAVLEAARVGHSALVRELVGEMGASVYEIDTEDGATPLHLAALGGHIGATRALLALRADPSKADSEGLTPLHYVATTGRRSGVERPRELLQLLVGAGGDALLAARSKIGLTVLHLAAAAGDRALVEWLLSSERGAAVVDPSATDASGVTPAAAAEAAGHVAVAELILPVDFVCSSKFGDD
eukprot:CAMPEP_0203869042 /NCGR_PEP_ID=MMETSP0359-20131031/17479_1 /ASSEMBLY_ACC=CAM_ASM_000338 /TAXON_ID=268821 /ORGANISM="Scrippsiella Hangoei, Strain SHTV-5" /LENGTH=692 /DNA_ID=CAMNT_0050787591 /DNA_START=47 /DNA_END=2122 /DNA_ORIENTATION=+